MKKLKDYFHEKLIIKLSLRIRMYTKCTVYFQVVSSILVKVYTAKSKTSVWENDMVRTLHFKRSARCWVPLHSCRRKLSRQRGRSLKWWKALHWTKQPTERSWNTFTKHTSAARHLATFRDHCLHLNFGTVRTGWPTMFNILRTRWKHGIWRFSARFEVATQLLICFSTNYGASRICRKPRWLNLPLEIRHRNPAKVSAEQCQTCQRCCDVWFHRKNGIFAQHLRQYRP